MDVRRRRGTHGAEAGDRQRLGLGGGEAASSPPQGLSDGARERPRNDEDSSAKCFRFLICQLLCFTYSHSKRLFPLRASTDRNYLTLLVRHRVLRSGLQNQRCRFSDVAFENCFYSRPRFSPTRPCRVSLKALVELLLEHCHRHNSNFFCTKSLRFNDELHWRKKKFALARTSLAQTATALAVLLLQVFVLVRDRGDDLPRSGSIDFASQSTDARPGP